jgi:hypothetical protein
MLFFGAFYSQKLHVPGFFFRSSLEAKDPGNCENSAHGRCGRREVDVMKAVPPHY